MRLKLKLAVAAVAAAGSLLGSMVPAHAALLSDCVETMNGAHIVCIDGTNTLHNFTP